MQRADAPTGYSVRDLEHDLNLFHCTRGRMPVSWRLHPDDFAAVLAELRRRQPTAMAIAVEPEAFKYCGVLIRRALP